MGQTHKQTDGHQTAALLSVASITSNQKINDLIIITSHEFGLSNVATMQPMKPAYAWWSW